MVRVRVQTARQRLKLCIVVFTWIRERRFKVKNLIFLVLNLIGNDIIWNNGC